MDYTLCFSIKPQRANWWTVWLLLKCFSLSIIRQVSRPLHRRSKCVDVRVVHGWKVTVDWILTFKKEKLKVEEFLRLSIYSNSANFSSPDVLKSYFDFASHCFPITSIYWWRELFNIMKWIAHHERLESFHFSGEIFYDEIQNWGAIFHTNTWLTNWCITSV